MVKPDKTTSPEVSEFAAELEMWAKQNPERETLVKWLLTRTVLHHFEGTGGKFVVERTNIEDFDIQKAVRHALEECMPNPGLPTYAWTLGGPTWPRAYAPMWPKAYCC